MSFLGLFGKQKRTHKPYEHRATSQPRALRLPDSIGDEYKTGASLFEIALSNKTTVASVRRKLDALGIEHKRYQCRREWTGPRKVTPKQITWILEQDDQDVPHAEIARHLNVTRERVRQICLQSGHRPRRARMTKAFAVQEAREAKKVERQAFIQMLADKWNSGISLADLATLIGVQNTHAAQARIGHYRARYPGLFNLRRPKHWNRQSEAERQQHTLKLAEMWKADATASEIAEQLGYKNPQSAYASLAHHRFKYPDLFPERARKRGRRAQSGERMLRVSEAWIAGKSVQDIARQEGYERFRSVHNAIKSWRSTYPDLFPPRRIGRKRSVQNGNSTHPLTEVTQ